MYLVNLGNNLKSARKKHYPADDQKTFAVRVGVSRATYQKMEKGDLSVTMAKYYEAAYILDCQDQLSKLFTMPESLLDD